LTTDESVDTSPLLPPTDLLLLDVIVSFISLFETSFVTFFKKGSKSKLIEVDDEQQHGSRDGLESEQ
jgi:hypothetical protein